MTTLAFTIPNGLWLSANDRRHWADKARATRALRQMGKTIAQKDGAKFTTPVLIIAHIGYRTGTRADAANGYPTCKALIDGVVDAGMLIDDDSEHLIGPLMVRDANHGHKGIHTVRLELTEAA